jgi:hypothetical protein
VTTLRPLKSRAEGRLRVGRVGLMLALVLGALMVVSPRAFAGTTWSAPTTLSPVTPGTSGTSVSCVTAYECVAIVGSSAFSFRGGPTWSGPTSVSVQDVQAESVFCHPLSTLQTSPLCLAVGGASAAVFNGKHWTSDSSIDDVGSLTSVSCPAFAGACEAVDSSGNALQSTPTGWSTAQSIDPGHALTSVSCNGDPTVNSLFCATVDDAGNAITSPAPVSIDPGHRLNGVSCPSPSLCIAVDNAGNAFNFNGTDWTGPTHVSANSLTAISCPVTTDCVAVDGAGGSYIYNGTGWSYGGGVTTGDALTAVACPMTAACFSTDDAGNVYTLGVLMVTTTTLAGATVGHSYSATLSASGGIAPYKWSGHGLPRGLRVNSNGVVSGTPRVPGTFTFTVKISDQKATGVKGPKRYKATASVTLTVS